MFRGNARARLVLSVEFPARGDPRTGTRREEKGRSFPGSTKKPSEDS